MPTLPSFPPKPVSQLWRPELTRLPRLHFARRLFRNLLRWLARGLIWRFTRPTLEGLENFPAQGPAILIINHLGDADAALVLAALPAAPEALGKVELHAFPILGRIMEGYGIIWLHRGRPDRRALRCALQALTEGRYVLIAPEGRYTLTGGLERGGPGAAWLALTANVPVVPIALTGTENNRVYTSLRNFRKPAITLRIGQPFRLKKSAPDREHVRQGSEQMMRALAVLLPSEYRGTYDGSTERM